MQPLVEVEAKTIMAEKENQVKVKIAKAAKVKIGDLEVDGFLMEDGTFGMSQTQVFGWVDSLTPLDQASKRYIEITKSKMAKKLVPEGFTVHRKISVLQRKEKINLVPLDQVTKFLTVALAMGYIECAPMLATLSGVMLHELFCEAFDIVFSKEERDERLKQRKIVRETFRPYLTDALKRFGYSEPWRYGKFVHEMQSALGIQDGTRDILSIEDLVVLESAQRFIGMAIDQFGIDPYEALKRYVRMKKDVE